MVSDETSPSMELTKTRLGDERVAITRVDPKAVGMHLELHWHLDGPCWKAG